MTSTSPEQSAGAASRWGLPTPPAGTPADADLLAWREKIGGLAAIQRFDPAVAVEARIVAGTRCLAAVPASPAGTMLWFHGGGFRTGLPEISAGFATRLAARTRLEVLLPAYPLAPEHPFPAALIAGAGICDTLAEAPRLLVGGDSAGGGLALALAVAAREADRRMPEAIVLLSPWLDLTASAASYADAAASDAMFSAQAARDAAAGYLAGQPADTPLASPLRAGAAGLPPAWIGASTHEVLRDDSVMLAASLAAAGQRVELSLWPELPHVWPMIQPDSAATARTVDAIAAFVAGLADGVDG